MGPATRSFEPNVHNSIVLTLVATSLLLLSGAQDTQGFRDSFAMRKADYPLEKPDPAIVKCMDIVAERLRKEVKAASLQKVEDIVNLFYRSIQAEESFESGYRSISAAMSFSPGRVAVGVRMGAAARLRVFSTATGKPIAVPKALEWSYQYDAQPQFLPGGAILVNGPGIQDAGVRYGYRVILLKPSETGFKLQQSIRGIWTLEEESESHLRVNGLVASLNTIDLPKAFFTDNTTRLFTRNTIYELDQTPIKVRSTSIGTSAIRIVDEWMAQAIKNPDAELEKLFVGAYGKEPQMIEEFSEKVISEDSFEVTLKFEKTFVFTVESKGGKETVKSLKIEG